MCRGYQFHHGYNPCQHLETSTLCLVSTTFYGEQDQSDSVMGMNWTSLMVPKFGEAKQKMEKRVVNCGISSTELSWCAVECPEFRFGKHFWTVINWVGGRKIKFQTGKRCNYFPKIISCASFQDIRLVPPRKLTWNLEMMVFNRNLLFQGLIFRFHVSFRGCKSYWRWCPECIW